MDVSDGKTWVSDEFEEELQGRSGRPLAFCGLCLIDSDRLVVIQVGEQEGSRGSTTPPIGVYSSIIVRDTVTACVRPM